jgi:hypothetical protein
VLLVRSQSLLNFSSLATVFDDLLRASPDEVLWVEYLINISPDWLEELRPFDSLNEVVLTAIFLDYITGLLT